MSQRPLGRDQSYTNMACPYGLKAPWSKVSMHCSALQLQMSLGLRPSSMGLKTLKLWPRVFSAWATTLYHEAEVLQHGPKAFQYGPEALQNGARDPQEAVLV